MNLPAVPSMIDPPFGVPLTPSLVIELSGEPKGKGRPRFSRRNGIVYTPDPTRNYEAALRFAGQSVMLQAAPWDGPLKVDVLAAFSVPRSWSKRKHEAALSGLIRPTGRPDLDNIVKMLDALNGVVWLDDAQIVTATVTKRYSERPRLRVEVQKLIGAPA